MRRSRPDTLSLAQELAAPTYGLVSRHLLRTHGIDRHRVRHLATQGEVLPRGTHAVQVRSTPWDLERSPIVAAVINSGASAWADGAAALILNGLTGWPLDVIDIGVPENAATRRVPGVRRHRFRKPPCLRASPVSHAEPAHAAVHAAAWSETDAAAAAVLEACSAQQIVPVQHLRVAVELLPTVHRRGLIKEVLTDLARRRPPLHELDLARMCRRHGLTEPDRLDLGMSQVAGDLNLEARWAAAKVTLRLEPTPYPLREESYSDIEEIESGPTIAGEDDTVLHGCVSTLHAHPTLFFERLERLLRRGLETEQASC